jgi:hypothetical protein
LDLDNRLKNCEHVGCSRFKFNSFNIFTVHEHTVKLCIRRQVDKVDERLYISTLVKLKTVP